MPASVAYLTHDEVNAALACRMAKRFGLNLTVLAVKDANHAIAADQLVLDLDHLPLEYKSNLFLRIGRGELRSGVAVHSYHLTPGECRALCTAGVRMTRRLTAAVLTPRMSADSTT
ncbi:MAG TPA: hypothetical protein VLM40_14085 [Gemmata sp.]|nr:hypothetical protein [Gemmata sp.]